MKEYFLPLLVLSMVFLSACASVEVEQTVPVAQPEPQEQQEEEVELKPVEEKQEEPEPAPEPEATIDPEVEELLNKFDSKVTSMFFKYKGPETGPDLFEVWWKNDNIKIQPARELKFLDRDEAYDFVYLDTKAKTAATYCKDNTCSIKGKKGDVDYDENIIYMPYDWLEGIETAEKVGEELIERRETWKIETNKGTIWVETFFGIPVKGEVSGLKYTYEELDVNSIRDAGVTP